MPTALLRSSSLNQVRFRGEPSQRESFSLYAHDPAGPRSFLLRLAAISGSEGALGEVTAVYRDGRERVAIGERFPADRLNLDPERPGLGIHECAIEDNHSHGALRSSGRVLSWSFGFEGELEPWAPFEGRRRSDPARSTPHPALRLSGSIELWRGFEAQGGHSRGSELEVIDVTGWTAVQSHEWGTRHAMRSAWTHCAAFEEGNAVFELATEQKVRGSTSLARLVLDGHVHSFDDSYAVKRARVTCDPTQHRFRLESRSGVLEGSTQGYSDAATALDAFGAILTVSTGAGLELAFTSNDGASLRLSSKRATLSVIHNPESGQTPLLEVSSRR